MNHLLARFLCSVFVGHAVLRVSAQGVCSGKTPCLCTYENGQYLDISALGNKDDTPRFYNVSDPHENLYSWNPCYNFTQGNCSEVAVCEIQPSIPHDIYAPLGYQDNYEFKTNTPDNSMTLVYTTDKRSAHIKLICVHGNPSSTNLTALGPPDQLSNDFYFELRSPLCCPQGTPLTTVTTTVRPTTGCPACSSTSGLKHLVIVVSVVAGLFLVVIVIMAYILNKLRRKKTYENL